MLEEPPLAHLRPQPVRELHGLRAPHRASSSQAPWARRPGSPSTPEREPEQDPGLLRVPGGRRPPMSLPEPVQRQAPPRHRRQRLAWPLVAQLAPPFSARYRGLPDSLPAPPEASAARCRVLRPRLLALANRVPRTSREKVQPDPPVPRRSLAAWEWDVLHPVSGCRAPKPHGRQECLLSRAPAFPLEEPASQASPCVNRLRQGQRPDNRDRSPVRLEPAREEPLRLRARSPALPLERCGPSHERREPERAQSLALPPGRCGLPHKHRGQGRVESPAPPPERCAPFREHLGPARARTLRPHHDQGRSGAR